jgi:hypothetical protein
VQRGEKNCTGGMGHHYEKSSRGPSLPATDIRVNEPLFNVNIESTLNGAAAHDPAGNRLLTQAKEPLNLCHLSYHSRQATHPPKAKRGFAGSCFRLGSTWLSEESAGVQAMPARSAFPSPPVQSGIGSTDDLYHTDLGFIGRSVTMDPGTEARLGRRATSNPARRDRLQGGHQRSGPA